jgi:hypothetical protein
MILTRIQALTKLRHFETEFRFRMAGGYTDVPGDPTYTYFANLEQPIDKYEETLVASSGTQRFGNSLLLRVRYSGWGRLMLATDPEPNTEEVGCTGTLVTHPADGTRIFDRAIYLQPDAKAIVRSPITDPDHVKVNDTMPALGVRATEIALVYASSDFAASLTPLGSANSVQGNSWQLMVSLDGITELAILKPSDVTGSPTIPVSVDLPPSPNGDRPVLLGENHLIGRAGEPIEPYHLKICWDKDGTECIGRSVFNGNGTAYVDYTPSQRAQSGRVPIGFDGVSNMESWVKRSLPTNFVPDVSNLIPHRIGNLTQLLHHEIQTQNTPNDVEILSYAERIRTLTRKAKISNGWYSVALRYGHTVSGNMFAHSSDNKLTQAVTTATGIPVELVVNNQQRDSLNNRWLNTYALAAMDTDALALLNYGEVYIPLNVSALPGGLTAYSLVHFSHVFTFPNAEFESSLVHYGATFSNCYWIEAGCMFPDSTTRIILYQGTTNLTEQSVSVNSSGYTYSNTGFANVSSYEGSFYVTHDTAHPGLRLTWSIKFVATAADAILSTANVFADTAASIKAKLNEQFSTAGGP